ncbi:MAG: acylphosphatase [Bacteroidota bacterium]
MTVRVHVLVEGLVQGVGFRWFAARLAESSGIGGHVRNLLNGQVEVEAEGDRSLVEQFLKELKVGPRSAHVTHLHVEWKDPLHTEKRFEIR